jgi:hypothetical protein
VPQLKVILAPAMDLAYVSGSIIPRLPRERANTWFVRVNLAAAAASYHVAAPNATTQAGQFFDNMAAAGY